MGKFNGLSAFIITVLAQFIVIQVLGFIMEEGSGAINMFTIPTILGGGALAIYLARKKDLLIAGWSGSFFFILNDLWFFEFTLFDSLSLWGLLFLTSLLGAFIAKKLLLTPVE